MLHPPTAHVPRPPTMRLHYGRMTHVATGPFVLYLDDGHLVYAKAPCTAEDIALPFFLHVLPKDMEDLPAYRRQLGFDNLDFNFLHRGMRWQDRCHAQVPLPEFEIDRIRTGQFVSDEATDGHDGPNGLPTSPWSVEIQPAP